VVSLAHKKELPTETMWTDISESKPLAQTARSEESVKKRVDAAEGSVTRFEVTLKIGGVRVAALLDTGASCSVLKESFFHKYCRAMHRPFLVQKTTSIKTVSGQEIQPLGCANLYIDQIQQTGKVIILPNNAIIHDMILGIDLLKEGDAVIKITNQELYWHRKTLPL
jgi:predicted aspartyl protease